MNNLGEKLRLLRLQRRWTQRELAAQAGISTPHISSIERGKRHPSLIYASRIADAFKVPLEYFSDSYEQAPLEDLLPVARTFSPTIQRMILHESAAPYFAMAERIQGLDERGKVLVNALISALACSKEQDQAIL